jgi:hydroxymethylbilane synthase
LAAIADPDATAASAAERAMLAGLDGSCRTPIGAYASLQPDGRLQLTGMVARPDGSFLLKRRIAGVPADAEHIGAELAVSLRTDSPGDIFA